MSCRMVHWQVENLWGCCGFNTSATLGYLHALGFIGIDWGRSRAGPRRTYLLNIGPVFDSTVIEAQLPRFAREKAIDQEPSKNQHRQAPSPAAESCSKYGCWETDPKSASARAQLCEFARLDLAYLQRMRRIHCSTL